MQRQVRGLNVEANPTDARVRSTAAGSQLAQLAQSLTALNPALGRVEGRIREEDREEDVRRGRQAALEAAINERDRVANGEIELGENRFFKQGFREQIGQNTAHEVASKIELELSQSPLRNSDDPAEIQQFISRRIAEETGGIDDGDVLAGAQGVLRQSVQNILTSQRKRSVEAIHNQQLEALGINIGNIIEDTYAPGKGKQDFTSFDARLANIRNQAQLTGQPLREIDTVLTQAVIAEARQRLDENVLDYLDRPRPDGTPPISSIPANRVLIENAKSTISRARHFQDQSEARAEKDRDNQTLEEFESQLVQRALAGNRELTDADIQTLVDLNGDISSANRTINAYRNIIKVDDPNDTEWESTFEQDLVESAVFRGDVDAVLEYSEQGLIPQGLKLRVLQQARTSRNTNTSSERAAIRFQQQQEARAVAKQEEAAERAAAEAKIRTRAEAIQEKVDAGTANEAEQRYLERAVNQGIVEPDLPTAELLIAGISKAREEGVGNPVDAVRRAVDAKYGEGTFDKIVPQDDLTGGTTIETF